MKERFTKDQELWHVDFSKKVRRKVIAKHCTDTWYWSCWVPESNSLQPLSISMLFPLHLEAKIDAALAQQAEVERQDRILQGMIYKLINEAGS